MLSKIEIRKLNGKCKIYCPNYEHCKMEHFDNTEYEILERCFRTRPRVGLGTYEEYFKN